MAKVSSKLKEHYIFFWAHLGFLKAYHGWHRHKWLQVGKLPNYSYIVCKNVSCNMGLTLQLDFQAQRPQLRKWVTGLSFALSGQRPAQGYLQGRCLTSTNANCRRTACSVRGCFRNSDPFPTAARLSCGFFFRQNLPDIYSPFLVDKNNLEC